jgi:nanoRNase/pAp phosphatase (c-di-AMP/oligoRNAs hydrolase)
MRTIDFSELKRIIESHRGVRTLITFHSIGDTDSVASAFALSSCFSNAVIVSPDFITSNSKHVLDKLGFQSGSIRAVFDDSAEFIVMVDVNNFEDCGALKNKLAETRREILIIDHHAAQSIEKEPVSVFNDESYNSTSSIVFDIVKALGCGMDGKTAELLAAGIVSDSAEFRNSTPYTFVQIGELLRLAGKDYQGLLMDMRHLASADNRIDSIKSLFSSGVVIKNGLVFVFGEGFRANISADDAIKVGADVALFRSISTSEISFSARLRPLLDKERGIHLGKVMAALAPIINGHGGGHPCAAGAYGSNANASKEFVNGFINAVFNPKA